MTDQQPSTEIDRYLSSKLSVKEREQFEQKLAEDPGLTEELRKWEPVYELVRLRARAELKKQLGKLDEEESIVQPRWNRPLFWSLAATVLVLCLVGLWWTTQNDRYSAESLVAMNLEPYEAPVQLRDEQGATEHEASTYFREGRYAEAALRFEELLTDSASQTAITQFYAGHSFLLSNDPEKAILYLSPVVEGLSPYREPARWYRALAYLKLGMIDSSRKDLQALDQYRTEPTAKLLQQLDGLSSDDSQ